jgi:serine phosphatase RsbU (regulator of sigma subunit)
VFFFFSAMALGSWFWAGISFLFLNVLLALELADKLTAKDELEVAREIQMGLMPKEAPPNCGYDIACFSEAAREVGGDYYDFIQPQHLPGTTFVVIGDVSGKGMGAALRMVQVQAILHNLTEQYQHPRDILLSLNENLRHILKFGSFFTISLASFNSDRVLHLCRAGHMPLIHFQKHLNACKEIIPPGIGVGIAPTSRGKFADMLQEVEVKTEPGDILLFYTDGVVETMNDAKAEFGEERLKRLVIANAEKTASEIQKAILSSLAQFRGAALFHDDLTLIVMKAQG